MKYCIVLLVMCALCVVTLAASSDKHVQSRKIRSAGQAKKAAESHANQATYNKSHARMAHEPRTSTGIESLSESRNTEKSDSNHIDTAVQGAKKPFDTGADLLKSAVNNLDPLIKEGVSLGTELAQRLINGPDNEDRHAGEKLIHKLKRFKNNIRATLKSAWVAFSSATIKPVVKKLFSIADDVRVTK